MDKFGLFRGSGNKQNPYAQPPAYNDPYMQRPGGGGTPPPGRGGPGGFDFEPSPSPGGRHAAGHYSVEKMTSDMASYAQENVVAVPEGSFPSGSYVIINDRYVLTARVHHSLQPGTIAPTGPQREWGQLSLRDPVKVDPFDIFARGNKNVYLGSINVEIDFYSKNNVTQSPYEQETLAKRFLHVFKDQVFEPGQLMAMEMSGKNFRVKVLQTSVVDLAGAGAQGAQGARGILVPQTDITFFKPPNGLIVLKTAGNKPRVNAILQPNFRFEDMGIGGLDEEFNVIFRRAFASRIYPPRDVEKLGIKHVKGLLLYGPPGTGKTLIARQIGKMLNAVEPKIVNGPEMLSKYVGSSEENIRKLFREAELEYKEKGDESNLHIIIFDELDAVFKQRGSRGDGTGVGDNVVNQLLAKMDGVDQLNNILVIGMTNRRDLIDKALLRPGRFEVQLEISLPDEQGRRQILNIHTHKMRDAKKLSNDVNIDELAARTKNFSGAEIEGLVKSAASFALNRNIKHDPKKGITFDNKEVIVKRLDFMDALDENKPAFGVSEQELSDNIRGGMITYSSHITDILSHGKQLIEQVRQSDQFPLISVLVHGPPGSGKTALASRMALDSEFPLIKLVSPDDMIGMSETQRVAHLQQIFQDSYKSPLNVLVVDQVEDILDWVNIGPRFSNSVLQALKVFLRKNPPKDRKLIVFATSAQRDVLGRMDLLKSFNKEIFVPNVASVDELQSVFEEVKFLDAPRRKRAIEMIRDETQSSVLGLGIKNILFNIEAARLSGNDLDEFVSLTVRDIQSKPGNSRMDI